MGIKRMAIELSSSVNLVFNQPAVKPAGLDRFFLLASRQHRQSRAEIQNRIDS
jgi:hypothetical protein